MIQDFGTATMIPPTPLEFTLEPGDEMVYTLDFTTVPGSIYFLGAGFTNAKKEYTAKGFKIEASFLPVGEITFNILDDDRRAFWKIYDDVAGKLVEFRCKNIGSKPVYNSVAFTGSFGPKRDY